MKAERWYDSCRESILNSRADLALYSFTETAEMRLFNQQSNENETGEKKSEST